MHQSRCRESGALRRRDRPCEHEVDDHGIHGGAIELAKDVLGEAECGSGARDLRHEVGRASAAHSRRSCGGGNPVRDALVGPEHAARTLESKAHGGRAENADGMATS